MMLIPAVLALLTAAAPAQDPARGVIRGTVFSEPAGLPIPLAVVEADNGRQTIHAVSDSTGAYRLNVAAGRQTLRIRHLEHAPHQVEVVVPPAGEVPVDVALTHRPIVLAPVRVRNPIDPRADSVAASRPDWGVVSHRTVVAEEALNGTLDPGFGPGGTDGGDTDPWYFRGSSANLQLVLLDGAPVYAPFHMGGLVENFEPDVISSARLYLGGAPARYDGGLSYVMDLSTRSGREQMGAAGSVDMVAAGTRLEGPLGAARYLGSVRTVHGAALARLEGHPFPYDFADGLLRVDVPVGEGGVTATLFANAEGVRVDTLPSPGDGFARWGNLAGSLRYRGQFEGADVEVTLGGGRYDVDVPVRDSISRLFQLHGRSDRVRLGVDFTRTTGPVLLRYGLLLEGTRLEHHAERLVENPVLGSDQFVTLLTTKAEAATGGGYLDAVWQPTPRVLLRGGARADAFSKGDVATLAPRASATWLISDGAALTLAGGRYHQYVRFPKQRRSGDTPENYADSTQPATEMAVAGATHLSLGLDQQMPGGVRLGLEGFYKRFHGLPAASELDPTSAPAHISGMDVWVRRNVGSLTGWFGYSLNWAWRAEEDTTFRGRQTISAGVRGVAWRRTTLSVRVAYGSGVPSVKAAGGAERLLSDGSLPPSGENSTDVDLDTDAPLTGKRDDPFLRLDVELSRTWSPRLAGRRTQMTPYLRVINALGSRDALFYRYFSGGDQDRGGFEAVGTLPLVPVFGVDWKI
ncbi:MAG TPA: TonB-dependent receptor [Longimicrobium sp.]|nr:TonB-dependent receptor [Longimicrobium sp.]